MALHGHSAPVTCIASCGLEATDRDLVLSGAAEGTALLWSLRQLTPTYISASVRRPAARRCPALVIRGHRGPLTVCAVSDGLGLALTCSDGRVLLTAIEGNVLLRALRAPVGGSSVDLGKGGEASTADTNTTPFPRLPGTRYTACALTEAGYAALAGSRLVVAGGSETTSALTASSRVQESQPHIGQHQQQQQHPREEDALMLVHDLEVYTVNGRRTAKVSGLSGAVRCLSTAGRGELLVVGGDRLMLEVRTTADLVPVWSLDPNSWATIDCFSGGGVAGGLMSRGGGGGESGAVDWPAVECVELGPKPNAPVLVCVGTSDGSLLVQVDFSFFRFFVLLLSAFLSVFSGSLCCITGL